MALLHEENEESSSVPVFELPEWNTRASFEDAWTDVLIEVQGSPHILDRISLDDRKYLIQCIRTLRKSYSPYPLRRFTKLLFINHGEPVCQILLTTHLPEQGRWAQIEIQPPKNQNTELNCANNHISCSLKDVLVGCFGSCLIISLITWSLTVQIV